MVEGEEEGGGIRTAKPANNNRADTQLFRCVFCIEAITAILNGPIDVVHTVPWYMLIPIALIFFPLRRFCQYFPVFFFFICLLFYFVIIFWEMFGVFWIVLLILKWFFVIYFDRFSYVSYSPYAVVVVAKDAVFCLNSGHCTVEFLQQTHTHTQTVFVYLLNKKFKNTNKSTLEIILGYMMTIISKLGNWFFVVVNNMNYLYWNFVCIWWQRLVYIYIYSCVRSSFLFKQEIN